MSKAGLPLTRRWGIASALASLVALLVAVTIGLTTWLDVQRERTIFRQQLAERALLLAQTIAEVMADALSRSDIDRARDLTAAIGRHPDISSVAVYDAEGRLIVARRGEQDPASLASDLGLAALRDRTTQLRFVGDVVAVAGPVTAGGELVGGLSFTVRARSLDDTIVGLVLERVAQGLLLGAVGVLLSYAFAQHVTRPLWRVVRAAERVAAGDLDVAIATSRRDEIGELARSFERIHAALRDSQERMQQALQESDRRLQEAQAKLRETQQRIVEQERLLAMGQMASGIAHDFNNALAPILGFTELLLRRLDQLDDRAAIRSYLELIHTAAQDAANAIGRLSEFYGGRINGGRVEAVNANATVEQVIALTQPRWKDQALAQGITITIRTDLQPVPAITANDAELREALINLVFNAVDAMPEGGTLTFRTSWSPRLGTTAKEERGTTRACDAFSGHTRYGEAGQPAPQEHPQRWAEDGYVTIEVSDTGTGMSEEVRRRCLEAFFSTKGEHGTGLGLAIVHGIVQRHGGLLEIDSALGKGTTVRIHLPVRVAPDEDARGETGRASRALRVLVVDDEPRICELLPAYLTADGHAVEVATSGREALEKFRAGQFDVVMTDRGMPEINGDQVAAAIKGLSPSTPVILVTGFGELMKAADEWPSGIDAIVSKPFTLAALRHTLTQLSSEPSPSTASAEGC